jgi:hypothetical protein
MVGNYLVIIVNEAQGNQAADKKAVSKKLQVKKSQVVEINYEKAAGRQSFYQRINC